MDIKVNPSLSTEMLQTAILTEVTNNVNIALRAMKGPVEDKTREAVGIAVQNSPEYKSILDGQLHGELGIENPEAALTDIIAALKGGVLVEINKVQISGSILKGGMNVSVLKNDFREVLDLASVKYDSINFKGQLTHIPWLQWLLEGSPVITTFFLSTKEAVLPTARSKKKIMIPSKASGRTWQLQQQNTVDDNWLTRAFSDFHLVIEKIVLDELRSRI